MKKEEKNNNFLHHFDLPNPVCLYKWNWSTIHLQLGTTNSCHRVNGNFISPENYSDFHNTPKKLKDRELMLEGKWPSGGCEYCKDIEKAGGISDRMDINQKGLASNYVPKETFLNTKQINLTPTMVEVYFSNLCNQGCVYCSSLNSTVLEAEDKKFGFNPNYDTNEMFGILNRSKVNYEAMLEAHWKWFKENGKHLKRYHILGGEPFYQKELETNLDILTEYPCPDLEVSIFSNLKVEYTKLIKILEKIKLLLTTKKIKSISICLSFDCWGAQVEYLRYGLNLKQWEENFLLILKQYPEIQVSIHSTLTCLTMDTFPELCKKIKEWNKIRFVHQSASFVDNRPHMHVDIFPKGFFKKQFEESLSHINDPIFKRFFAGFEKRVDLNGGDAEKVKKLKNSLDEMDRRRNTNWKELWPWLDNYLT